MTGQKEIPSAEELIESVAGVAIEKKASTAVALMVGEYLNIVDWFVILSAPSRRQVRTLVEEIEKRLASLGAELRGREGVQEAEWVLLDYGEVVVHLMTSECRDFYALERLWAGVPSIDLLSSSERALTGTERD